LVDVFGDEGVGGELHLEIRGRVTGGEFEVDDGDSVDGVEDEVGATLEVELIGCEPGTEDPLGWVEAVWFESPAGLERFDLFLGFEGDLHFGGRDASGGGEAVIEDNTRTVDPLFEIADVQDDGFGHPLQILTGNDF
jgi:hypothetical protein